MKILLTGALGFIGKNFLLYRPKDWQVFALDLSEDKNPPAGEAGFQKNIQNAKFFAIDLTDENKVKHLAQKIDQKFDICLHLAANGDPALSAPDPLWDLRSTTETLINVCQNFQIKKIVYLSSGAVYDGSRGIVNSTMAIDSTLPYAISHHSAEQYARFFKESGKVEQYIIIRFFGAYGPYEPPRKIYTKLVKDFNCHSERKRRISDECRMSHPRQILHCVQDDIEFTIRGDGKNLIDAMYVEDAIRGFEAVIMSQKTNLTVDFCKGDHPTINALVKDAAKIFDVNVKIKHEGIVPEYNKFYASPKEFKEVFNFSPKIPLDEGLKKLKEHLEKSEVRNPKHETNPNI